jgi:phosphate transport system substrate-binding protein
VRIRTLTAVGASAVLALGAAACGSNNDSTTSTSAASSTAATTAATTTAAAGAKGGTINAGGSTFAQPVYTAWGQTLKASNGLTLNFAGTGSGAGVSGVQDGTLDFGGSDAAMTDDEEKVAAKKGDVVHIPAFFGAVTASYNLPGVKTGLKLDGATLANIYLGKVKKWNDPQIASQNSGITLPSTAISVCHRSDSSGTTKAFLSYLGDYSKAWTNGPGVDKTVKWPTGTGAKGNDGVAACVKQTEGAIGYVEQAYALTNNFTYASLKNKAGNYVAPTLASVSAAGDSVKVPADLRFSIANAPGDQTYPDASATFIILYKDVCKAAGKSQATAEALKTFLDYGLGDGQTALKQLAYAPLPTSILTPAKAKVASLECNGAPIS